MAHLIIIAAGKGSRMRSAIPKPLIPVGGVPMIRRVLDATEELCPRPTVVIGRHGRDLVRALGDRCDFAVQQEPLGTGDALRCGLERPIPEGEDSVLVLPADHPFITADSMKMLIDVREAVGAAVTLATVRLRDFEGHRAQFSTCGRILRDAGGGITGIVELKDASSEQAKITEVNVSYYCFQKAWLRENIEALDARNAAGEYYLTDLVGMAVGQGEEIRGVALEHAREGMGVNTPEQLKHADRLCEFPRRTEDRTDPSWLPSGPEHRASTERKSHDRPQYRSARTVS